MIAAAVGFLFVDDSVMEVPTMATACAFFLMLIISADQSWKAFRRQGRAAIIKTLKPDDGGHSTIHPDDISIAMSPSDDTSKLPNFAVFATGGFVHGGVEWQGDENYFVCPPEHIEQTGSALICSTKFRKVDFDDLQDYIQAELLKLKFFSKKMVSLKHNLWFGMTSKLDGTSTTNMLTAESGFLDQTAFINQLKKLIRDKSDATTPSGKSSSPITFNIPER